MKQTKTFLTRYFHDGAWWGLEIQAYDFADAQTRCKKLGMQLDGELVMTIPAIFQGAWFPNLILTIHSWLNL